ncbi:hypothetical protein SDC9_102153 [bioreactor metagenome]|uniref:Sortase family protein n=1 Tax=bioreactor metagenome TaxID=1076179 RepID=A0A645ARF9_9ZZZZ
MKNTLQKIFRIFLVNASLLLAFAPALNVTSIPVTGNSAIFAAVPTTVQSVDDFAASVKNGNASQITGVYATDKFALTVVQQPSGNAGYVSTASETVTQFGLASSYGSTGLLAHNYLAGKYFSSISSGATLTVIFGDGSKKNYTVSEVRQYKALDPTNLYSNFVNLNDSSKTLSSTDVFNETFGKSGALVLQTCITKDGNSSWGRLFIIAYSS